MWLEAWDHPTWVLGQATGLQNLPHQRLERLDSPACPAPACPRPSTSESRHCLVTMDADSGHRSSLLELGPPLCHLESRGWRWIRSAWLRAPGGGEDVCAGASLGVPAQEQVMNGPRPPPPPPAPEGAQASEWASPRRAVGHWRIPVAPAHMGSSGGPASDGRPRRQVTVNPGRGVACRALQGHAEAVGDEDADPGPPRWPRWRGSGAGSLMPDGAGDSRCAACGHGDDPPPRRETRGPTQLRRSRKT